MDVIFKSTAQDDMISRFFLNILFFAYGLIIVLCDNDKYLNFIYIINILLGLSFIFLVFIYRLKIHLNLFFKIYFLFVLFAIASSFWSDDFFYSARRSLNLVLIFLITYFIYNINEKYHNFIYIIYGVFAALIINFLWLLGIIDIGLTYEGWRFTGSVLQANNFVFILVFADMMIVSLLVLYNYNDKIKLFLFLLLFPINYMVLMTASKSGLFTTVLLFLFFIIHTSLIQKNFKIIMVAVFTYLVFSYTPLLDVIIEHSSVDLTYTLENLRDRLATFALGIEHGNSSGEITSTTLRIMMIHDAINLWANSPIYGNGLAAFEQIYGHYSHNNMTELLASFGIVGFFLYYSLYVYLFTQINKINKIDIKIMFSLFLILYLFFDQTIVSYTGKFKILSFLILFLMIKEYLSTEEKLISNENNKSHK